MIHIAKCSSDSKLEIIYVVDPDRAKSETLNNWNVGDFEDKRKKRIEEIEKMVKESGVLYEINILNGRFVPYYCEVSFTKGS